MVEMTVNGQAKDDFADELAWQKPAPNADVKEKLKRGERLSRLKFLIGGVLILGAVAFLILSGTMSGARFFITVDEVLANPDYVGQTVRLSGAVIGETIEYNPEAGELHFAVANIPGEFEDLAQVLHEAANDPGATRLPVFIRDEAKPDLLQHEAQAILTGTLGDDGVFYATELLLKCPSRFEEANPGAMIHPQGA